VEEVVSEPVLLVAVVRDVVVLDMLVPDSVLIVVAVAEVLV
jgi:hypothetical protein